MTRISDRRKRPLVLYHAVSSFQLLEVMLHRMLVHENARAVLVLPDFITEKYPQVCRLAARQWFDTVVLFPYLRIPHGEEAAVRADVCRAAERLLPYALTDFSQIYVAGAHFYFSLYLLANGVPFAMFEDAAGMLSRPEVLYEALRVQYPQHAEIARRHGLFDGENPLIRQVICLKEAQRRDVSAAKYRNFSVEDALEQLPEPKRRRLIRFFLRRRIRTGAQAILLTQRFASLGMMSEQQQRRLYERLRDGELKGQRLLIKRHPDDTLDYAAIFPDAEQIRAVFPSELLPYVFIRKPAVVYSFDSTGCANLRRHFTVKTVRRELYAG
ncbi:MAG: hypothetical protein ACLSS9_07620 [Acutalibacteraceae bacterium]